MSNNHMQLHQVLMLTHMRWAEAIVFHAVFEWHNDSDPDARENAIGAANGAMGLLLADERYQKELKRQREALLLAHGAKFGIDCDRYFDLFLSQHKIENPARGVLFHLGFWCSTGRIAELRSAAKWLDELALLDEKIRRGE